MRSAPHSPIATFLEARQGETDVSENTLLAYGRDLFDFESGLKGRNTDLISATRGDIEEYLIGLDQLGMARSTRGRRLSSIRQFYRFAFEENWRGDNPSAQIKGPQRQKLLPKTLSEQDVDKLLQAAGKTGRSADDKSRNICLFQLLYATGMRVSELVSLPVSAARGNPHFGKQAFPKLVLSQMTAVVVCSY